MKKIRVLVVDDSITIRNLIEQGLNATDDIEVVAKAQDAYEARDMIIKLRPDVMTLDIEMPRMNGLDFLRKLMPQYPMPVIVVSSLDDRVFDAMSVGAVDFVHKPEGMTRSRLEAFMMEELGDKVRIASTVKVGSRKRADAAVSRKKTAMTGGSDPDMVKADSRIIAIGASTGGTEAIYEVIKEFGTDIPGVVIVQHMPAGFTEMYAERLDKQCRVAVREAQNGDRVKQGQVLLAPGNKQMRVIKVSGGYQVECKVEGKVNGHCPAVNVLFNSVAQAAKDKAIGVLLTGMGTDGAEGLLEMKRQGAVTIGQDEVSSIVYGMPRVAYEIGAVTYQASLHQIPGKIYNILNAK